MKIAVAGGTGLVGTMVVDAARAAGHEADALSRATGIDLVTGRGLTPALTGIDVVIDTSNAAGISREKSVGFFEPATRNLLAAGADAGVRHLVTLSIVGIDRVPSGYYEGKRIQERLIADGPLPWTVLRATQFHEFAGQLLSQLKGPVVLAPRMRSATVAAREVAEQLVVLAADAPVGLAPELAGPEVHEVPDLMRRVLRARGSRRPVLPVRVPGAAGKAMANGGLLPLGAALRGRQTFAEWLAEQSAR